MKRKYVLTWMIVLVAATLCVPALAQTGEAPPEMTPEQQAEMEAYMKAGTPGAPHATLAKEVGTYDIVIKSWMAPEAPPMESTGTATRTMVLDGRVMQEELSSSMMGMPFTGLGMTGYDNVDGQYWAIWMDSMSTGIFTSKGNCDENSACTFVGSWNDPVKGTVTARMISKWTSPTTQTFAMYGPGADGKEMKMMEMTYTRK